MNLTRLGAVAAAAVTLISASSGALAHGMAGERFFPATILTDDPFVADEISLPQVSLQPPALDDSQLTNIEIDLSKRITPNTGIVIGDEWQRLRAPGFTSVGGLGPLRTGAQYQLFIDGPHQALGLLGLNVIWGHTGRAAVGAPDFTTLSPTFDFGKGFGDLPDSFGWLRAFAVTGQVGYAFPTRNFDVDTGSFIPQVLVYGASIQYSMPYLKSEIHDYQLPDFINHLFPIVEAQFATPVANNFGNSPITTGTINPGVIWVGTYFQVGAEAVFPVNRASGTGVGFLGQLHLYLDDIFPNTIGRPLLGGSSAPPQQLKF